MEYRTPTHIEMSRVFGIFTNEGELMHQLGVQDPCFLQAAILKELLDNAIDAGASALEVRILENKNKCFITVRDNGDDLKP